MNLIKKYPITFWVLIIFLVFFIVNKISKSFLDITNFEKRFRPNFVEKVYGEKNKEDYLKVLEEQTYPLKYAPFIEFREQPRLGKFVAVSEIGNRCNQNNLNNYTNKEILIISSLVEKEAIDDNDKRLVSSVVFNRLRRNMKLDIDASVIYSITKGEYKLMRPLNYEDLKIDSIYNTYLNKGLPPQPICIPGLNTIKIVLENYKSPYLFYFFDNNKKSHIFSKNYKTHINKLNEYRKNK